MDEHDYIFGSTRQQLDETKEVKIRLPISHLIKLHGVKLLQGQNISDTVALALNEYFAATGVTQQAAEATTA